MPIGVVEVATRHRCVQDPNPTALGQGERAAMKPLLQPCSHCFSHLVADQLGHRSIASFSSWSHYHGLMQGGSTTKMALKFPQLPCANSVDNIWLVAYAEGAADGYEMYAKVGR